MAKTRCTQESERTLTSNKAIWDEKLTVTFCELCVKEIDVGNRPTTYLNARGWENVGANFHAQTGLSYGRSQFKNKWETLKKEWKLWNELTRKETGLGWCPIKKTINASEEWWAKKIQLPNENPDVKIFKKRGFDSKLNDVLWHMFGDTVATGEHDWAPSSGVLPSGASTENATHVEVSGDSNENDSQNDSNHDNHALKVTHDSNALHTNLNNHAALKVRNDKGKKQQSLKKAMRKKMSTQIEKLCDTMSKPRNSVSTIVFPRSKFGVQEAIYDLRALEQEIPKRSHLYYFAIKTFQAPVKREVFLSLDEELRSWWLQSEYEEHNATARFTSLLATSSCGFQPFNQTPPPPPPPPPQGSLI